MSSTTPAPAPAVKPAPKSAGRKGVVNKFAHALRTSPNTALLALSVVLGLAVGLAIWAFDKAIHLFHHWFVDVLAHETLSPIFGVFAIVIALGLAGLIVGALMWRFVGTERHHGVAGIMEAVALGGGRLPFKKMPFKAVASALSLGAGASVGPEDPSVQIGSNLGSWFGQGLHLKEDQVRLLVAAGAASAIAAAFKAPIAGVFFALEVILNGAFETRSFGVVVLASVVASAFTQAVLPEPVMGQFNYTLGGPLEIPLFAPLGLGMAFVSVYFVKAFYWQHELWHKYVRLPRPLMTALAGVLVGLVAIVFPQIMGTGREVMSEVLSARVHWDIPLLLALAAVKFIMTTVSLAGGFVGGIFAPSLFVGAMLGSAYGHVMTGLFSVDAVGDPQAYTIAGMAAAMAGVVRSPITAIMLVFELTNDYRLILPIMLSTVICVAVAERLEPYGIYTLGLLRKGVRLIQGREVDLMQGVTVGDSMVTPPPTVTENTSLVELRDTFQKYHSNSLCVLNEEGLLTGIVTLSDLQQAYAEMLSVSMKQATDAQNDEGDYEAVPPPKISTVGDICTRDVITVHPEDTLLEAIRAMSLRDVGRVPVVKLGTRECVGLIGRHGIMRGYNLAVTRKLKDQHTAERVRLNVLIGAHVFEFYVERDAPIVGMNIAAVRWPRESTVASVQRRGRLIVPHGSTEIQADDVLTIIADPMHEPELRELMHAPNGKSAAAFTPSKSTLSPPGVHHEV